MTDILLNRSEVLNSVSMASVKSEDESDASMRQRLVTSLSQSFPGSALSKALQCMTESDDEMKDPLSSSCFAELRMEKADMEEDDELTSLAWLQDTDLLKNIHAGEEENADAHKENGDLRKLVNSHPQTHPSHVPYNPHKHIHSKPPYSFSCLIFMAVEDSPQKRLPVKDIYNWILTHFPYFQNAPTGWKNSVRHNLSLNKCFKKVDKDKGQTIGKGSLWCIDPDYRPNLLQALRKTPYHPYHQLQMLASPQSVQQNLPFSRPLPLSPRFTANQISPHLFPFLSKRLAQSSLDSDIDVANALVSLKGLNSSSRFLGNRGGMWNTGEKRKQMTQLSHHVKRQNLGPIICTLNPSEDHTYSVKSPLSDSSSGCASPCSSEEQYDFGSDDDIDEDSEYDGWASDYDEVDGDNNNEDDTLDSSKGQKAQLKFPRNSKAAKRDEEDEDMKIAEGANALLNLAGINTKILPLRSISPVVNTNSVSGKTSSS